MITNHIGRKSFALKQLYDKTFNGGDKMQILKADNNKSITISQLLYHTKSIAVMYTEDDIVMPEAYFVKPSELTFSQLVKEIINSNMDQPNEPGKPLDYFLIYTNIYQLLCFHVAVFAKDEEFLWRVYKGIRDVFPSPDRSVVNKKDFDVIAGTIYIRGMIATENCRGMRYDKCIVQNGIDQRIIEVVIMPQLLSVSKQNILYLD